MKGILLLIICIEQGPVSVQVTPCRNVQPATGLVQFYEHRWYFWSRYPALCMSGGMHISLRQGLVSSKNPFLQWRKDGILLLTSALLKLPCESTLGILVKSIPGCTYPSIALVYCILFSELDIKYIVISP